ncbi:MAG: ABC transporter ATP-binding protein, partial [Ignavibacteria bacterium]|nr:ABC transporter ATP-binding protein [Ignavibacteria bacterium]
IGRKEIREILLDLKSKGKTIFLNSHLLSEVEMITDRVAILNKGVLVKEGTVDELTRVGSEYQFTVDNNVDENTLASLRQKIPNISQKFSVNVKDRNELNLFIDQLRQAGILIESIVPVKYSLEDMFINVIQESNKEIKN